MSASDTPEITRNLRNASPDVFHAVLSRRPGCLNALSSSGRTLLHEVVKAGNIASLTLILHLGADPNTLSKKGKTSLYYAVRKNSIPIVDILLVYNANYRLCQVGYPRNEAFEHLFSSSTQAFHGL